MEQLFTVHDIIKTLNDGKITKTIIRKTYKFGKLNEVMYFDKNNNFHRDDGPAIIKYWNDTDKLHYVIWYQNNMQHRNPSPDGTTGATYTQYLEDGITLHSEYWYVNNKLHRDGDLPACILYSVSDKLENFESTEKRWYKDGKLHREGNLPALILTDADNVRIEEYYLKGILQNKCIYKNNHDILIEKAKKLSKEDVNKCLAFLEIINTN